MAMTSLVPTTSLETDIIFCSYKMIVYFVTDKIIYNMVYNMF
jgi:hypothetical protein